MKDPRLKILYLIALAVLVFVADTPAPLLGLLGLQVGLWFVAGLSARDLFRSVQRLLVFITFIVLSYGLFGASENDTLYPVAVGSFEFSINLSGLALGALRSTRIVTLIVASQIVQRSGDGATLVEGLKGLRAPDFLAYGLDLVLAELGPDAGRGGGKGGGKGRNKKKKKEEPGFEFRRLLRGDTGALVTLIQHRLVAARRRADAYGLPPEFTHDLVVISGLGIVAMALRFIKLAPGLPIAPGHKGVILIPLYILAHHLVKGRWGATRFGLIVGILGFFMGMGKYGLFDILRHVGPGLFVDLSLPLLMALSSKPRVWVFGLVGFGAAGARVLSLVVAAWAVEVPPAFYALLLPMTLAQMTFGMLSGFVAVPLIHAAERMRPAIDGLPPETVASSPPHAGDP